jgi:hypothetical protein
MIVSEKYVRNSRGRVSLHNRIEEIRWVNDRVASVISCGYVANDPDSLASIFSCLQLVRQEPEHSAVIWIGRIDVIEKVLLVPWEVISILRR